MSSIDYHEILRQADVAFPSSLDEAAAAAVAGAPDEHGVDVGADGGAGMGMDVDVSGGLGIEGDGHSGEHHGGEYQPAHEHEHGHDHDHAHQHLDPAHGEFLLPEEQHDLHHAQLGDVPVAVGGDGGDVEHHGESSRAGAEGGNGPRGPKGLTVQEKKERQKAQNRKAAERSRLKKRTEQMALESNVQQMQNENARLRARLAALIASRPSNSPALPEGQSAIVPADPLPISLTHPPLATPPAVAGTGIDYTYVAKLLNELTASKSILLDKTLELSRLLDGGGRDEATSGGERDRTEDEKSVLRRELLAQWCKMVGIKVESRGLEAMLRHLRGEKESLGTQRERVLRELEGRRAVRDAVAVVQGEGMLAAQEEVREAVETAEERDGGGVMEGVPEGQSVQEEARQEDGEVHAGDGGSMEDIRGWIDAAVNIWDQEEKTPHDGIM